MINFKSCLKKIKNFLAIIIAAIVGYFVNDFLDKYSETSEESIIKKGYQVNEKGFQSAYIDKNKDAIKDFLQLKKDKTMQYNNLKLNYNFLQNNILKSDKVDFFLSNKDLLIKDEVCFNFGAYKISNYEKINSGLRFYSKKNYTESYGYSEKSFLFLKEMCGSQLEYINTIKNELRKNQLQYDEVIREFDKKIEQKTPPDSDFKYIQKKIWNELICNRTIRKLDCGFQYYINNEDLIAKQIFDNFSKEEIEEMEDAIYHKSNIDNILNTINENKNI